MLFRYLQRGVPAGGGEAQKLAESLGIMPATAAILIGRGIGTAEAGRMFFNAGPETLRDPFGLAGMAEAAERVERAVERGERITIYGDYDVDGVCATSILMSYLTGRGADCSFYIPSRHTEGYGLNIAAIDQLAGTGLLITVDCGISNAAEVARARELGMDVVVTDHHECPDTLPDCTAVVNPKRPGQGYGFAGLCGAGVAFKLVHALGGVDEAAKALDLAALATVADIVPLVDENRAIVRMGIERINRGERPGVKALKEVAGLDGKPIKAGNIGFALAPRINAGGRMDLSRKSAEMMLTCDLERARAIARELDSDNAERMRVEESILTEAIEMVERDYSFSRRRAIVLYQPHWNTGVTGIVASRIVERYHRPVILFGSGEGACYGSGRSVPGVHLFQAMKACSEYFLRYGGHEQAAGCALAPESVELFAAALDQYLAQTYDEQVFLPARHFDAELKLAEVGIGLARDMDRLEPCGFGNPRPVFLLKDVELAGLARTNDGKHLRMRFGGPAGLEGIAFRQGAFFEALDGAARCDALAVPDVNEWMGRERVQAIVEHVRLPQGLAHARQTLGQAGSAFGLALGRALAAESVDGADIRRVGYREGLALLTEAVERSCWGTLALCFTAESARAALEALEGIRCIERVYVCTGLPHEAARRENALVLAPDIERLPLGKYDNIFVFDGWLAGHCAAKAASALNNGANWIIMNDDFPLPTAEVFSRDNLLRVFRAMRTALIAKSGPRERGDWGWLEGCDIPARLAELAARIFLELGLLRELEKRPWLEPAERRGRADLNDSIIYRRLTN